MNAIFKNETGNVKIRQDVLNLTPGSTLGNPGISRVFGKYSQVRQIILGYSGGNSEIPWGTLEQMGKKLSKTINSGPVFRIRIQSGQWIRIRNWNPDPNPGEQNDPQKQEKFKKFVF
jgi:hypothetical protein